MSKIASAEQNDMLNIDEAYDKLNNECDVVLKKIKERKKRKTRVKYDRS